ncbi:hypothetical protein Javan1_0023 [Streptococcus phage Javan1]|nr:hypothetical protein Javan1_0023 [Streptococcus phage Javan1]
MLDDDPKYEEGYRQAVEDMKELLSEKVRQKVEDLFYEAGDEIQLILPNQQ